MGLGLKREGKGRGIGNGKNCALHRVLYIHICRDLCVLRVTAEREMTHNFNFFLTWPNWLHKTDKIDKKGQMIRLWVLNITKFTIKHRMKTVSHTLTLTCRQPSALVALSFAFISDSVFKFCSVHFIGYNFQSTFRLRFCLEIISFFKNSFFLLEVSREAQRLILNTLLVARIFCCCFAQFPAPGWWTPQHTHFVSGYF